MMLAQPAAWLALCCAYALAPRAAAAVQANASTAPSRSCDGDTVTAIAIRTRAAAPATTAQGETREAASRVLGLPHVNTRAAVVRAYLRLAVGQLCTELNRSESERLLRAQPFVASANVRAVPTAPGQVRVDADVVDEVALVVGGKVSRGTVSSVLLGTQNFDGRGLSLAVDAERGFAYRPGFGVRAQQHALFGRPAFIAVDAERRAVIGEHLAIEVAAPFLTELQLRAFHSSAALESGYSGIVRPDDDGAAVFVRRTSYDIGWVTRFGRANGLGTVGLIGAAVIGEDVRSGQDIVIVTDTGLVAGSGTAFGDDYPDFAMTRLAVIGGMRSLRFTAVHGFDALNAEQDMGIGTQLVLLVAPGMLTSGHRSDVLVASEAYAGVGGAESFLVVHARAEARSDRAKRAWDGVAVSGRLAWYAKPSSIRTRLATLDVSAVRQSVYPVQLTLRDPDGGLPGFGNATLAGGGRLVGRLEERLLVRPFGNRVDLALGVFAAAGVLWAGDVPYGQSSGMEGSAGISLLAAYPAGSKRTFRVDLAFPFDPTQARTHLELRFRVGARAGSAWMEPRDVARARTGSVPVSLVRW